MSTGGRAAGRSLDCSTYESSIATNETHVGFTKEADDMNDLIIATSLNPDIPH
jgi:hypothetical protein